MNNFGSYNGVDYQLDIDASYTIACTLDADGDGIYKVMIWMWTVTMMVVPMHWRPPVALDTMIWTPIIN